MSDLTGKDNGFRTLMRESWRHAVPGDTYAEGFTAATMARLQRERMATMMATPSVGIGTLAMPAFVGSGVFMLGLILGLLAPVTSQTGSMQQSIFMPYDSYGIVGMKEAS